MATLWALAEDIIFSDPVLQRIFFDPRRVAPRTEYSAGHVSNHWHSIAECQVIFLKTKRMQTAEAMQYEMRAHWFALRKLCDGYFIDMPCGYSDGCEHVELFAHDTGSPEFEIDMRARAACWCKYAQRQPPPWGDRTADKYRRRRHRHRGRRL